MAQNEPLHPEVQWLPYHYRLEGTKFGWPFIRNSQNSFKSISLRVRWESTKQKKPKKFISDKAITGLYYFDNKVIKYAKQLAPSKRGETEITDLLKLYQKKNKLNFHEIGRGALWSDAGKVDDLINIANYVLSYEKIQLMKIGCIEEIAFKKKWINKAQINKNIKFYGKCSYSEYLKNI